MDLLQGNCIVLRPAQPDDKQIIFLWLTESDITSKMMGPPLFADNPIPSWQEFDNDYQSNYFTDHNPEMGRSFIIEFNNKPIGHISYNSIDRDTHTTKLDIWMAAERFCRQGFGIDAIQTLCSYLSAKLHCKRFLLAPSERNNASVNAYRKCGFEITNEYIKNFTPDYYDTVIMLKNA